MSVALNKVNALKILLVSKELAKFAPQTKIVSKTVNMDQTASLLLTLQNMVTTPSEPAMTSIANMTQTLELEFVYRTPNQEKFINNAQLVADVLLKIAKPTLTVTLNSVVPMTNVLSVPPAVSVHPPPMFAQMELAVCRAATITLSATQDSATLLQKEALCPTNAQLAHQAVTKSLLLGKMPNNALFLTTTSEMPKKLLLFATKRLEYAHLSSKTLHQA